MAKKVTAADFLKGPGPSESGIYTLQEIIDAYYGNLENFYQCEFVHKGGINDAYRNAKSQIEKWAVIRRYYEFIQPAIDREDHRRWAAVYEIPFDQDFTPIERDAWCCFRIHSVPMYPQYPALKYFLDFANPKIKLAIEMDGRQWHDPQKDAERDRKLIQAGWTIYRIPGAECYTKREHPEDIEEKHEEDDPDYRRKMRAWYCETSEGVIQAIRHQYFRHGESDYYDHPHVDFINETLEKHRSGRR